MCMHRGKIMWGHSKKTSNCKPKREAPEKNLPTPGSWASSLQNCGKICFYHWRLTVCGILLWWPEQIDMEVDTLCVLSHLQLPGAGLLQRTETWPEQNKNKPITNKNLGKVCLGTLSLGYKDSTEVLEILVTKALNRYFFLSWTPSIWTGCLYV